MIINELNNLFLVHNKCEDFYVVAVAGDKDEAKSLSAEYFHEAGMKSDEALLAVFETFPLDTHIDCDYILTRQLA